MTVVRVDLRQPAVRARLREIKPPASTDPFPFSDSAALTDLPVRLLLIVPLDDIAASDAEELALKLLGSDPSPRTVVALVAGGGRADGSPRRLDAYARTLPAALSRHPDVRFLDLRAEMLSFGHPRTGLTRLTGDDGHGWPEAFVRDLVAHLMQVEIFDAVWETVPPDRPATVGMRVASLGEGRERAVADLALRLGRELDPTGEPYMGSRLPARWEVDKRLLPAEAPYPQPAASMGQLPPAVRGLAGVAHDGPFKLLSRRLDAYNEGVGAVLGELEDRPRELARLLRESERRRDGAPGIDPLGAAKLDAALGGIVFGDELPKLAQEGDDPAARVGELLETAAERQADGVSVSLLADWLRSDASRVDPKGPAAAAERLNGGHRPWAQLASELQREGPPSAASVWALDAVTGSRASKASARPAAAADDGSPGAPPAPDSAAAGPRLRPVWELPRGLRWYVGARAWRPRWRWLTLALAVLLVGVVIAQAWARLTGNYLFPTDNLLIIGVPYREYEAVGRFLIIGFVVYLLFGFVVALALRRWGSRFRFGEVPELASQIGGEAQAVAIAEVARFGVRRDYARISRAAADILEHGSQRGSEVSRGFGEKLGREYPAFTVEAAPRMPPHRELVAAEPSLAGTDAGGIYRVYPLYVSALRATFAAALVRAIRERWPRIRGVFWEETEGSIIAATSAVLELRLAEILEFGLRRGDLVEEGVDPADDLAERLWSNAGIRERALRSLHLDPSDPMPLLATPADTRLLDQSTMSDLIIAIPPTLEPLIRDSTEADGVHVITSSVLETAAAIRIFAFQPGIYDFAEPVELPSKPLAS